MLRLSRTRKPFLREMWEVKLGPVGTSNMRAVTAGSEASRLNAFGPVSSVQASACTKYDQLPLAPLLLSQIWEVTSDLDASSYRPWDQHGQETVSSGTRHRLQRRDQHVL
ncbi:unnamed protein product [Prorocentrum cordatum]|uniref:Uncharacterized protein n=1 Tax=Prorocentrum cordatum TaxID=2364126 RepID=A0ABN9W7Q9_9DINO|nr:unnamed protein product [Polarella glacialis]|mmetsp:Transcript_75933/g.205295  ORF Transcript_75933/g.205295 Transcript_75933/m.205295 type:complete len:110 (+) Transcript_75933:21-350(+)